MAWILCHPGIPHQGRSLHLDPLGLHDTSWTILTAPLVVWQSFLFSVSEQAEQYLCLLFFFPWACWLESLLRLCSSSRHFPVLAALHRLAAF